MLFNKTNKFVEFINALNCANARRSVPVVGSILEM